MGARHDVAGQRAEALRPVGITALAGTVRAVLEGMRPGQWIKNAFVLAGVAFAGKVLHPALLGTALAATLAFCLASGAAYLLNDSLDATTDRLNARTASRPVARGDLSPRLAQVASACSAVVALAIAALVNVETLGALAGYLVLQVAYSERLKHVLFLDVLAIAAGFVLRAAAGGLAIHVRVSPWLLLSTGLLATFLALAKRRGEAAALGGVEQPARAVMDDYSVALLDQLIAVVTPATLVVYALYAVNGARTNWMLLTVPFVVYGIFRVLFLVHRRSRLVEEPALAVLGDRPLLVCVALWAVSAAAIVAIAGAAR